MDPGKYLATATEVQYGTAKTGTEQIAVTFQTADTGDTITWVGSLTERAIAQVIKSLRACGWAGVDVGDVTAEDLKEQVELDCQEEEYEGDTRLKVKWVNKPGSGGFAFAAPIAQNAKAQLNARFRAMAQGSAVAGGKAAGKPAPPKRPAAPPAEPSNGAVVDESELPF